MPTEIIFTIAAVITAIGIIIGGLIAIYRFIKRISESIGVDHEGRTLSDRMGRVEHQLWENGGSSLADRVNVIGEHSARTTAEVEMIKDLLLSGQLSHAPRVTEVPKTRARKAS